MSDAPVAKKSAATKRKAASVDANEEDAPAKKSGRRGNMQRSISKMNKLQRDTTDITKLIPREPFKREIKESLGVLYGGDKKKFNMQSKAVDVLMQYCIEKQLNRLILSTILLPYCDAKMLTPADYRAATIFTTNIQWHKLSDAQRKEINSLVDRKKKPADVEVV